MASQLQSGSSKKVERLSSGRNKESLEKAVGNLGKNAAFFVSDASKVNEIDNMYEFIKKNFGGLDGAFVNAGAASLLPVQAFDESSFDQLMNTNVKSTFFTLQKGIPHFKDGASIVLNASVTASRGSPLSSVYGATKAAVRSMARSFAAPLVDRKIRVNAVSPGPIETPLWHKDGGLPPQMASAVIEQTGKANPMKRYGTPEEVAAAVTFLLAPEASYITGIELFVDGGYNQL